MSNQAPFYLSGQRTQGTPYDLRAPGTGNLLATVHKAQPAHIAQALTAVAASVPELRRQSTFDRYRILTALHQKLNSRQEDFARSIAEEAGKPLKSARGEVARCLTTFRLAAEEATRISGIQLPVDIDQRSLGYHAVVERFPVGPCAFLTPFNFPLNLVAHKVAPALAAGCPFIVRPSLRTPLTALLLGDLLAEVDLPPGSWHILPSDHDVGEPLLTDDRIKLISFTGSPDVGWMIKSRAGKKPVILELGNAAVIVEPKTDLKDALPRIVNVAFGYAGQSCISVQRIFLHESIAPRAAELIRGLTQKLKVGEPLDETTDVGPLIDEAAARRVESWVQNAQQRGAKLLIGGLRHGSYFDPTLLTDVPADDPLNTQEVFGPVAVITPYDDFDDALNQVNATRYGLQAGIFTRDLFKARRAFERLDMGGVIINDVPTTRIDNMPYGGIKDSGLGREGVRYAIEHLTEPKVLLTRYGPLES